MNLPLPPKTPTLEKMRAVSADSEKLGQFIEWLQEDGVELCDVRIEATLARYFGIDLDAAEREKREILAHLRLVESQRNIRAELLLEEAS